MSKRIAKAWTRFMQSQFNVFKRSQPNIHKDRRYANVELTKEWQNIETKRKRQRLALIEYQKKLKKRLLEAKLAALEAPVGAHEQTSSQDFQAELTPQEKARLAASRFESYNEFVQKSGESPTLEAPKSKEEQEKDLKAAIVALEEQLATIKQTKAELASIEQKIEDLEPDFILVEGIQKKMVLNAITYYEFQYRNLQGVVIHPETIKSLETVHYHVENNMPVSRTLLFETVPELFETEIGQLEEYERQRILAKRPRLDMKESKNLDVFEAENGNEEKEDFLEGLKRQEYEFREFVYSKAIAFCHKWEELIITKLEAGFPDFEAVLTQLENRPKDLMTDEEREMADDFDEIKRVQDDYTELIKLNKVRTFKYQREIYIPEFVKQNEKLHAFWVKRWEELVSNSIDFRESIFIPDNSSKMEAQLDAILKEQKIGDLRELIESSNKEFAQKAGGDNPLMPRDPTKKDNELLKKLNVLSSAMNTIPEKKRERRPSIPQFQGNIAKETPEEQRILVDELPKVLYLNNQDPQKYNLSFWADHFNIVPEKLRNIFNYVAFPVPDHEGTKDTGRLYRFVYHKE
eukprot:TRINITY_DN5761_c0_g2_i2.p1 TRINITY_DN5761_c0_g2~~TRINITY_DN5761_c0_g2_i2.p1  ORF type:complete len:576 (-),score=198.02 TRINITY_DN5761_c0_g2_i2:117-1844(-)